MDSKLGCFRLILMVLELKLLANLCYFLTAVYVNYGVLTFLGVGKDTLNLTGQLLADFGLQELEWKMLMFIEKGLNDWDH
jgi:hypothetical protein